MRVYDMHPDAPSTDFEVRTTLMTAFVRFSVRSSISLLMRLDLSKLHSRTGGCGRYSLRHQRDAVRRRPAWFGRRVRSASGYAAVGAAPSISLIASSARPTASSASTASISAQVQVRCFISRRTAMVRLRGVAPSLEVLQ